MDHFCLNNGLLPIPCQDIINQNNNSDNPGGPFSDMD